MLRSSAGLRHCETERGQAAEGQLHTLEQDQANRLHSTAAYHIYVEHLQGGMQTQGCKRCRGCVRTSYRQQHKRRPAVLPRLQGAPPHYSCHTASMKPHIEYRLPEAGAHGCRRGRARAADAIRSTVDRSGQLTHVVTVGAKIGMGPMCVLVVSWQQQPAAAAAAAQVLLDPAFPLACRWGPAGAAAGASRCDAAPSPPLCRASTKE